MKKILLICVLFFLHFQNKAQSFAWAQGSNSVSAGEGFDVATDPSGNVYNCGVFSGTVMAFGTQTITSTTQSKLYLVKYNASGTALWARTQTGGLFTSTARSVHTDASGNVFICGSFSNTIVFGTSTLTGTGTNDSFIVKYDSNGNVLWAKSGGGNGYDGAVSSCADAAGNSFICGTSSSSLATWGSYTLTNTNTNPNKGYVVKYDPAGNVLWLACGTSTSADLAIAVSCDASGNSCLAGYFVLAPISFGSYTLTNTGQQDLYLVKYNPAGVALWANGSTGVAAEYASGVSVDPAGDIYLSGYFTGTVMTLGVQTFTQISINNAAFLSKFSANGTSLWGTTVRRGLPICDISAHGSGAFIVGNLSPSSGTFQVGTFSFTIPNTQDPMFFASFNSTGAVMYATVLSGGGDDIVAVANSGPCIAFIGGDYYPSPFVIGTTTLYVGPYTSEPIFTARLNMGLPATMTGNFNICAGQSTTLSANVSQSYTWSNGASSPSIVVTPSLNTVYSVSLSTGCGEGFTSQMVTVNPLPLFTVGVTSPSVCAGDPVSLTAYGNATFSWSGGASNGVPFVPVSSTTYTVLATSASSCTATSITSISVVPIPTLSPVSNPTALCVGSSATLLASGANSYTWYPGASTNASLLITPTVNTTYSVVQANANCSSTQTIEVKANSYPTLNFNLNQYIICLNNSLTIHVSGASSYTWNTLSNDSNLFVSPLVNTIYTVSGSNANTGCTSTKTVQVNVDNCNGINETIGADWLIKIYPNPATEQVTLEWPKIKGKGSIELSDLSGRCLQTYELSEDMLSLKLTNLTKGVYSIILYEGGLKKAKGRVMIE